VTALVDAVLPLIRIRSDVSQRNIANAHGDQMHEAVAILRQAAEDDDPAEVFAVTQRAIASALKVIMRADDSSGIIVDACRDLLDLHPVVAARARPAATKLVDWMLNFQFENECDYFTIDPVDATRCNSHNSGSKTFPWHGIWRTASTFRTTVPGATLSRRTRSSIRSPFCPSTPGSSNESWLKPTRGTTVLPHGG
jgi:hypothetical protein